MVNAWKQIQANIGLNMASESFTQQSWKLMSVHGALVINEPILYVTTEQDEDLCNPFQEELSWDVLKLLVLM